MADVKLKGHKSEWDALSGMARSYQEYDATLTPELTTDKDLIKVLPCLHCKRILGVTTFLPAAWAKCSACKAAEGGSSRARGSVDVVQAGRTDPKVVVDLSKVLLNPSFAQATCPVHPEDDAHIMELKHVHYSPAYGPYEYRIIDGRPVPVQIAPGETVMHQCTKCMAVVTFSTTAVTQFRRMNEPRPGRQVNTGWADALGTRDDGLKAWSDKQDDFPPPVAGEEVAE